MSLFSSTEPNLITTSLSDDNINPSQVLMNFSSTPHELYNRSTKRPTPMQMQGLPVALSGRDMVGIAFSGSGKTLTFALPLLMISLEEEVRMPLIGGEGPLGMLLAPNRELARQTYEVLQTYTSIITSHNVRCQLLIGGEDPFAQS